MSLPKPWVAQNCTPTPLRGLPTEEATPCISIQMPSPLSWCPGCQGSEVQKWLLSHLALKNGALLTEVTSGPLYHFVSGPTSRSPQLHLRETWKPKGRMHQPGGFGWVSKSPQPLETAGDTLWTCAFSWEKPIDFVQRLRKTCELRSV